VAEASARAGAVVRALGGRLKTGHSWAVQNRPVVQRVIFHRLLGYSLSVLPAALSAYLFVLTTAAALLVVLARPLLQGPLSVFLDRLAAARKGAIGTLTGALAFLVLLIEAVDGICRN